MHHLPFRALEDPLVRAEVLRAIRRGDIFIYPTDTIYGIGCNALKTNAVKKIRALKKRDAGKPFSIIAPTKAWIRAHVRVRHAKFLAKLPGPYTLLLEKKNPLFLRQVSARPALGVRIPAHAFSALVKEADVPFVTTSVNLSGQPSIRCVEDAPPSIAKHVHWILDAGELNNPPSTIYDLTGKKPVKIARK